MSKMNEGDAQNEDLVWSLPLRGQYEAAHFNSVQGHLVSAVRVSWWVYLVSDDFGVNRNTRHYTLCVPGM